MKILKLLFLASIVSLASCDKEETTDPNDGNTDPTNPTPTADHYFNADISGDYILIEDGLDGYTNKTGSNDEGSIKRSYATISNSSDVNSFEIMVIGDLGNNPSEQDVYDMFKTGSMTFSNRTKDGVLINWKDNLGNIWTSDTRFGSASGSSCVFTEIGPFTGGNKTFTVKGNINCKVYNLSGQSKTITNGKFIINFHPGK